MDNEQIKNYFTDIQEVSAKLLGLRCILEVLSVYCDVQAENDEVSNIAMVVDRIKDEVDSIKNEFEAITDEAISNLLPL